MNLFQMNNSAIDIFLWKISGADIQLIVFSGERSKSRFRWIGLSFLIIVVMTFLALSNSLIKIFESNFLPLILSAVLTFLIITIYRLNIISLEPHTLPYNKGNGSLIAPLIIRISVISLFAFFVAKQFEFLCFGWLVQDEMLNETSTSTFFGSDDFKFMQRMFLLNARFWFVWFITPLIIYLFLFPTRVKYALRRDEKEYYNKKSVLEKSIVEKEYAAFKAEYKRLFQAQQMQIEYKDDQYFDPPFNTKRRRPIKPKSQMDFFQSFKR